MATFFEGPSDKTEETFNQWWSDFTASISDASQNVDLSIYNDNLVSFYRVTHPLVDLGWVDLD